MRVLSSDSCNVCKIHAVGAQNVRVPTVLQNRSQSHYDFGIHKTIWFSKGYKGFLLTVLENVYYIGFYSGTFFFFFRLQFSYGNNAPIMRIVSIVYDGHLNFFFPLK